MATDDLIVSVSGIRGVVGRSLTPEVVVAFARALGTYLQGGTVLLARDGRASGFMLRHAVLSGLMASGCRVLDLGVVPTPTVGLCVRHFRAVGALQITASHNPAEWNGLKLFGPDGRVLSAGEGKKIADRFTARDFVECAWDQLGYVEDRPGGIEAHCERILQLVDVVRIRAAEMRAFVDANGGSGGPLARLLMKAFQVQATIQGGNADGDFLHTPEPTEENLRDVAPLVVHHHAAVGFALDPDADRLALIDETGRYIGEELTLALALRYRLEQQRGPVVVNMSTSRVNEDIARQFGCPVERSAVGEANVADRMIALGAVIGGEGNGGVIDPRVGYVRDPFIGMGMILDLMAKTGKKLSELVAELPRYHIVKDKYTVPRELLPELYRRLQSAHADATANTVDGLRLDWADRWVHIRPSNTEPIVRVIAEAPQEAHARDLCRAVGALLPA
jgi:phosphomannomutase